MKCKVCDMDISEGHEFFTFPAGTGIHQNISDCVKLLLVEVKELRYDIKILEKERPCQTN